MTTVRSIRKLLPSRRLHPQKSMLCARVTSTCNVLDGCPAWTSRCRSSDYTPGMIGQWRAVEHLVVCPIPSQEARERVQQQQPGCLLVAAYRTALPAPLPSLRQLNPAGHRSPTIVRGSCANGLPPWRPRACAPMWAWVYTMGRNYWCVCVSAGGFDQSF